MKKRLLHTISSLLLIAALGWVGQATAISDAQYGLIQKMGQLNGVALQCGFTDEVRRMKKALIVTLPKRRQLGDAYDDETNKSFMQFIEEKRECPEQGAFVSEVDGAVEALIKAFQAQ